MGALLDLEDVAAGHPNAQKELAELYAFRDAIQGKSMNPEKSLGEVVAGSGSALARDQLAELRKAFQRYETVRRFNVQQFKDAYTVCLRTGKPFDQLIDELSVFKSKSRAHDAQSS